MRHFVAALLGLTWAAIGAVAIVLAAQGALP